MNRIFSVKNLWNENKGQLQSIYFLCWVGWIREKIFKFICFCTFILFQWLWAVISSDSYILTKIILNYHRILLGARIVKRNCIIFISTRSKLKYLAIISLHYLFRFIITLNFRLFKFLTKYLNCLCFITD